jgi:hypothetical protein
VIGLPPQQDEDEAHPDWYKMWGGYTAPVVPEPPKEKPLPTFHNRPRAYSKNLKDYEEK